ncbi:MAG TPA: DNA recombination protein RmuC [Vicinamibacterales bacterium]|nr:DNA recombination protein RmuC [Vicinamibacterales bacterium]
MSASLVLAAFAGALVGALAVALVLSRRQTALVAEAARLETALDAAERRATAEREHATATETTLRETFTSLSRDALRENRADFLHDAVALLDPMRATLDKVQTQLAAVDRAREGSHQALVTQLRSLAGAQEQLRAAAEGLTRSLKSPNARGRWGEVQLRRVVELAGMVEHCDFVEKLSTTDDQGARLTPDLVVKLPGDTNIVIDAKVPIDAYLAASAAVDDSARQDRLGAHVRQVRDHIRALGAKEYWRQFQPAPEFVVMFLPLEPLLATAFEQDATLFEQAASLRVIPATPMTLLALLKAVSYGWKQQQLARNAEEIQQIGRDLYERLATLTEHLEGVGKNIKGAADSYDRFIGSLETKVVPAARRFRDLGVSATKDVALPDPLTLSVRKVKKDDLIVISADDETEQDEAEDLSRH